MPSASRLLPSAFCLVLLCAAGLAGCLADPLPYSEAKEIDEKITEEELEAFLRVVDSLPEGKLPKMPGPFAPPPAWNKARTLPVNELVNEEDGLIDQRWNVEWHANHLQRNRGLARVLAREQMTPQQFAGLTLALAAALGREQLTERHDLDRLIADGRQAIDRLRGDSRPFHSLSPEGRHQVLRQAAWITRTDRADRLARVPPENVALVREHREALVRIFPAELAGNPLDAIADPLAEKGIPFEELPESGSDERIEWTRAEALVGNDEPDARLHE